MSQFQPQTTDIEKLKKYGELVGEFRKFNFEESDVKLVNPYCADRVNFEELCNKRCDMLHLNPWNLWQGHLDAEKLVIGQDWGCLNNKKGGLNMLSNTLLNDNLDETERLSRISMRTDKVVKKMFNVSEPYAISESNKLYFTNAILGIRSGDQAAGSISKKSLKYTSDNFTKQLIDIIRPQKIICLGRTAFDAITYIYPEQLSKFKSMPLGKIIREVDKSFKEIEKIKLEVCFHPAAWPNDTKNN